MDWLSMLRGVPGRLATVRRLTDEESARREADLATNGNVVCGGCGWQGRARRGVEGDAIYHGVFHYNEETKRFDVPATDATDAGRCVYECPRCHLVDDTRHEGCGGLMFLGGWMLVKGEWRIHPCTSEACAGRGGPIVELGCPGCGELTFWHHASNAPPQTHAWTVQAEGDVLTMSPSLVHYGHDGRTDCHFFIRNNEVQWCG